mgnify:FL=1
MEAHGADSHKGHALYHIIFQAVYCVFKFHLRPVLTQDQKFIASNAKDGIFRKMLHQTAAASDQRLIAG